MNPPNLPINMPSLKDLVRVGMEAYYASNQSQPVECENNRAAAIRDAVLSALQQPAPLLARIAEMEGVVVTEFGLRMREQSAWKDERESLRQRIAELEAQLTAVPPPAPIADAETLEALAEIGKRAYLQHPRAKQEFAGILTEPLQAAAAAILRAARPTVDVTCSELCKAVNYNENGEEIWSWQRGIDFCNSRIRFGVELPKYEAIGVDPGETGADETVKSAITTAAPTDAQIEELARVLFDATLGNAVNYTTVKDLHIRAARAAYEHIGSELAAVTAERDALRTELATRATRPVKVRLGGKTEMVCGFYFDESTGHVLLLRRTVPGHWQFGKLNGVGGKLESGESPFEAMRREFLEETGVEFNGWQQTISLSGADWRVHFFCAHGPKFEPRSCDEGNLEWHDRESLPANVMPNLKWLVPLHADRNGIFSTEWIESAYTVVDVETRPVKVRFTKIPQDYELSGLIHKSIWHSQESMLESMCKVRDFVLATAAAHAVVDVPPGVPSVEALAKAHFEHRRKANRAWEVMSWEEHKRDYPERHREYLDATAAIRDAVLESLGFNQ